MSLKPKGKSVSERSNGAVNCQMQGRGLAKAAMRKKKKCPLWEGDYKISKQKTDNPIKINGGHEYSSQ